MIRTERLSKRFDDLLAVDGVDLLVEPGQVLVLLGPNGAGKTTTVRMLTSILVPTQGRAWVAGYDVVGQAQDVRRSVGVLTEHHGLYGRMNADEYLEFYARLYALQPGFYQVRISQLLEKFGLVHARSQRLGEYSKGMRQKLALVRALIHEPAVLLLDEPTSAMDPESARTVREAIFSLRSSERTILLCTHNLVEAEQLADRVAIIRRGRIVIEDTLAGVKTAGLGAPEYAAHFTGNIDGWHPGEMNGVELVRREEKSLVFRIENPAAANPHLIQQIMRTRSDLITFQETPRSLEQAYLNIMEKTSVKNESV